MKFENKYETQGNIYKIREEYKKKYDKQNELPELELASGSSDEDLDEEDDDENKQPENVMPTKMYSYVQRMQFEEIGQEYYDSLMVVEDPQIKEKLEQQLQQHEAKRIEKHGASGLLALKQKRGDGFLNFPLRSLHCAAYLRCLYASIEFAPTDLLR